jgi:hypothetical protein
VTIVVRLLAAEVIVNRASITAAEADPDAANNTARQSVKVRHPMFLPRLLKPK